MYKNRDLLQEAPEIPAPERSETVTASNETQLDFLTREPVAGELLASRLATTRFSPEETLQLGIEIGAILNRAHSRGMVHGALSPFSVAFTADGLRILAPGHSAAQTSAPYCSPEQLRSEKPDARSDIFSFGAILYRAATGRKPFEGEGIALQHAILYTPPPAPRFEASPVSAALEGVIAGCLEKDPKARRQRIQNAVIELKFAGRGVRRPLADSLARPATALSVPFPPVDTAFALGEDASDLDPGQVGFYPPPARENDRPERKFTFGVRFWTILAAGLLLTASAIAAAVILNRKPAEPVLRFAVNPPDNTTYPGNPVVSPDGKYLTLSAVGPDGQRMLWLRPLDALKPVAIPGTEGGSLPFWSPDSQFIAFFTGRELRKVQIDKWTVQKIGDADAYPGGGAWNSDGTILYAPNLVDGLFRVPSVGGKREQVLKPKSDRSEYSFLWPQFLPDGKHFLFFLLTGSQDTTGVYNASLDEPEYTRVVNAPANALYAGLPDEDPNKHGYLLFMRERSLMGQLFNPSKMTLQGDPVTLADDVGVISSLSLAPISVSNNSILVYQEVGRPSRQLVWVDRSGKFTAVSAEPGDWGPPRVAPDGTRALAARSSITGNTSQADLMLVEANGTAAPITDTPSIHEVNPVWSPDGKRIAFAEAPPRTAKGTPSSFEYNYDIFVRPLDGSKPELLFKSANKKNPTDWSRDGRWLIFDSESQATGHDIWAYSFAEHRAAPVVETVAEEHFGALSPSEKWLAYQATDNNRFEIFVQAFDGLTSGTRRRYQISQNGGGMPRWRGDGTELYFLTASGRMMSSAVHPNEGGFEFDTPQMLFQTRPIPGLWNWFDVTSDGQHFLVNAPHEFSTSSKINVVSNWTQKLKD